MKPIKILSSLLMAMLFALLLNVTYEVPMLATFAVATIVQLIPANFSASLYSGFLTINNVNEREVFNQAERSLVDAFEGAINPKNYKLTQSYLRTEVALVAGVSSYAFGINIQQTNGAALFNTENRLELQDSFVVSSVGFFVALPSSSVDATFIPFTYPEPVTFAANADPLNTFYNSFMRITVNNNVLIPKWDLFRHYYVPATQAVTGPPAVITEQSGFDGFYPMEPNLVFVGSKNNQVTVVMPAGLATISANSRAILEFRGILVQNSTVVS